MGALAPSPAGATSGGVAAGGVTSPGAAVVGVNAPAEPAPLGKGATGPAGAATGLEEDETTPVAASASRRRS